MLFQGWSSAKGWLGGKPWPGHPYHPSNNVQRFNGNRKSDSGPDLSDPGVREHQAAYLRQWDLWPGVQDAVSEYRLRLDP